VYVKRDDRIGLSIPTTANAKAIVKQVKRALQVMSQNCVSMNAVLLHIYVLFLTHIAEYWWEEERQ
jgi:hypothetical protein